MDGVSAFVSQSVLLPFALLLAWPAAAQFGQITIPATGSVVTGGVRVGATQLVTSIDRTLVSSVRFESSRDGVSWSLIDIAESSGAIDSDSDWEIVWDTTAIASGNYQVRARFYLANGLIFTTPPIALTVRQPPVAAASGTISPGLQAVFDGTASTSSDGFIASWEWDFGDGTTATGPLASHSFAPNNNYTVILTVTDDSGNQASDYLAVSTFPAPSITRQDACVGKTIGVNSQGMADGPNGDKTRGWPPNANRHDGRTLGPLRNGNLPGNPGNVGKRFSGYAFEIVVDVQGNPAACNEIQLVRRSAQSLNAFTEARCKNLPGGGLFTSIPMIGSTCTFFSTWSGDFRLKPPLQPNVEDFDGDGVTDLDLSTQAKCTAQGAITAAPWVGGKWIPAIVGPPPAPAFCENAPFGRPGIGTANMNWKPDEEIQRRRAYRRPDGPGGHKTHPRGKIIWWDAPSYRDDPGATTAVYLDFAAIIRDSNNLYCLASFFVQYTTNSNQVETLNVVGNPQCALTKAQVQQQVPGALQ